MDLYNLDVGSINIMGVTIVELISIGSQVAMVLGGVVPFIPQYIDIYKSRNSEGFSLFVCLALLLANILRIMFWFGKHFELPLLAQSIIMFFTMLILVQLCVEVRSSGEIIAARPRRFSELDPAYFWKWTDFSSYLQFTVVFTAVVGLFTFIFINNQVYIEILGFMAVFTEAMLGTPQFLRNYKNKSTAGMSKKMVGFWTCGDIFKTVYFILRAAPAQFWICGALQVSVDLSIFGQVFLYRHNHAPLVVERKSALS